jgi:hypothetical protein
MLGQQDADLQCCRFVVAVRPEGSLRGTDAPGGCMIERASLFALRCGILSRRLASNNPRARSARAAGKLCVDGMSGLCSKQINR